MMCALRWVVPLGIGLWAAAVMGPIARGQTFTIGTVAGVGKAGFSGDGGPATQGELRNPSSVAVAPDGSLYIADLNNRRIRRVDSDGTITTVAGDGANRSSGDGGPATKAPLWGPCGVAVDNAGRVYIADSENCKIRVVRADGTIDTVAGTGKRGYAGDGGPARKALIAIPDRIDIDAAGNLYIAEFRNHVIRKLTPDR